jgi:hypothetical protein
MLLLPLLLAACGADPVQLSTVAASVTVGSIVVLQRSPFDALWSLVTGQDCSAVRVEQGKSWCRPVEPPPEPQQYCTRSLANVDCWSVPSGAGPGVADGPSSLTPAQEAYRTRRWP